MKIETFDSVWDTVSDTPERAENMRIRAEILKILNSLSEQEGFSQAQAASALGVAQPLISELARSKIQIFSIDKLITMMAHAGLHIQRIEIQYPHAA